MIKKSVFSIFAIAFISACGNQNNLEKSGANAEQISSQYEEQNASVDVEEQKLNAYLFEGESSSQLSLTMAVSETPTEPVKPIEPVKPEMGFEKGHKDIKNFMAEMGEQRKKRLEKQDKEGDFKGHEDKSKKPPSDHVEPEFKVVLKSARDYVLALIGFDKSPFETMRAAMLDTKVQAKSPEEFKALMGPAMEKFKAEKQAAWEKAKAGMAAHKDELEKLRDVRKNVIAACVLEKHKEKSMKKDDVKPEKVVQTPPTAEEIAAKKAEREVEKTKGEEKQIEGKSKATSTECVAAVDELKKLIAP